ncbi:MAG: TonB-dependent receptor, partial [Gammaproteobacteria bacterium]|nr:TonB-dependent receptor [Gammaproteobacteria bacterium]
DLAKLLRGAIEFGNDRLAALVSGEYLETGDRRIGGGERIAPSAYESKGGRIALSATPNDTESWLIDFQFARQPMTPRVDELVAGFGETEPSSSEFYFAPNERAFAHIRYTRDQGLLDATWNVDLGWQRIVDDRISRNFQASIRRYEENRSELVGLTINANGGAGAGDWVAGIEIYHDEVSSSRFEEDIITGAVQEVTARFPNGSNVDHAAVFGNYRYLLNERQSLAGGLRFSAISTDLGSGTVNQEDISADLGWLYSLNDSTQLVANLGFGFRAPNVFDLGTLGERPGNRFNVPNPDLDSEHITQIDLGLRHQGERIDIDVMFFALRYTDRIASVLTSGVTPDGRDITQSRNVDSASIAGIEFGGRMVIGPTMSAGLVLNYLHGEQTDESGMDVPGDRIPPFNGRLSLTWQATDAVFVEPFLVFTGEQDRLSPRDVQDTRIDPNGTPGWLTANIRASWDVGEAWQFSASFENLFDKRYRVHGSGIDSVGRNLYVSVRTAW